MLYWIRAMVSIVRGRVTGRNYLSEQPILPVLEKQHFCGLLRNSPEWMRTASRLPLLLPLSWQAEPSRAAWCKPHWWVICGCCRHDGDVQIERKLVSLISMHSMQSLKIRVQMGRRRSSLLARVSTCCLAHAPNTASNSKVILHFSSCNIAV